MIKHFKTVVFTYNFPHRKTNDFLQKLLRINFPISLILAAEFISIESPRSILRSSKKPKLLSSKNLAKRYGIPYYVVTHNSKVTINLLKKYNVNFGIITGARILDISIIRCFQYGILNFHPGLLPIIRGLDSILWSIYKNHPIGVTAHLINEKIDSGLLVVQKKILIEVTDNLESLYEKNYQLQLDLLSISLNLISIENNFLSLDDLGEYNTKMSYLTQLKVKQKVDQYIKQHS